MLKVKKFLCCMPLEVGGYVIGGLNFLFDVVYLGIFTYALAADFTCAEWKEWFGYPDSTLSFFNPYDDDIAVEACEAERAVQIGAAIITAAFLFGLVAVSVLCVIGVKRRNHNWLLPMAILLAIIAIWGFISFFLGVHWFIVLIEIIIDGYFFIVIYSLRELFKTESASGRRLHDSSDAAEIAFKP